MKSEQIKEEVQEEVVTEAETAPAADTLEAKVQQLEDRMPPSRISTSACWRSMTTSASVPPRKKRPSMPT